ncbi:GNAT family N-acetyltransferase [Formosa sp. 3Alg 14/1]|uniref:GNAT family N-acetyltransferase n=1 Tax=Formosa sp. 3Alg 14/1 TaxID=3382190 RepID=UPI0039BDB6F1
MKIFETERLVIKRLENRDKHYFSELLTDPRILELIPQNAFTENQVTERFTKNLHLKRSDLRDRQCACGIFIKGQKELIGLALFLINKNDEKELGYRFRVDYWEHGYGKETTKGLLRYYFEHMHVNKVTADVNIANLGSVKILDTFMTPVKEFFNERDNCTDRTYEITKAQWLKQEYK